MRSNANLFSVFYFIIFLIVLAQDRMFFSFIPQLYSVDSSHLNNFMHFEELKEAHSKTVKILYIIHYHLYHVFVAVVVTVHIFIVPYCIFRLPANCALWWDLFIYLCACPEPTTQELSEQLGQVVVFRIMSGSNLF